MSYRKHPSWPGWWVIDYRPEGRGGQRVRENFEGTEEEAKEYERRVRQLHVSTLKVSSNPPFREIAAEFVTWATQYRKATYVKSINDCLKHLLPHFGAFPPNRITVTLADAYLKRRAATPRAANQEIDMLGTICNWGADAKRRHCAKLPFKPDHLPVVRKVPLPPDPVEVEELFAEMDRAFLKCNPSPLMVVQRKAMLRIMYETGVRWIECRHLRWENLRWRDGRLNVGETKGHKARLTVLSPEVLQILEPIKQAEGYMFANPRTGKPYVHIQSLARNAKKLGISLKGTHTLRHALGTDAIEASGDLRGVQELLGHSDIKTSTIYTHIATGHKARQLEATREYRAKLLGRLVREMVEEFPEDDGDHVG